MDNIPEAAESKRTRHDHVTSFITEFNQLKQDLELELHAIESSGDLADSKENIAKLFVEFESLKKLLGNSAHFLPPYNIKAAQDSLNLIGQRINAKRDSLVTKKKFGFKRSNIVKKPEVKNDGDVVDATPAATAITVKDTSFIGFRNETSSQLSLNSEDVFKKDVYLENLVNCVVSIFGSPSTIHMKDLRNCRINSGPVETSIFIINSNACVFNLACQQLRIHASTTSRFNIHVTSRCIIEDCTNLSFARWNLSKWTYDGIEKDFEASNLDVHINNWDKILDFNWLATDKPSPNWSLIDD